MNLRKEVFSRKEKVWIVCIGKESQKAKLYPLADQVDWYNNQLLTRSLVNQKIDVDFGKLTLMGTGGLLPVSRLLVFGLGESASLGVVQARKFVQDLDRILEELKESNPWILLPESVPARFVEEVEKSRTSSETLGQARITLGGNKDES